ncbi:hypothetical protein [Myxococcus xanthus]|uniref:Uncharacterized protein n=1 Tax=Myxococcus xanthus TaxID=34 RepID=A0AAE6FXQ6_MYXXA|nr:hypothetical protein [Myxococcus xanthus]QDE67080.1 hypothetical protein BHS09_08710 [Myxococcus xanthus]QDE74354.1 hypothetical protein BHS08_08720 [Myxococcus xanthus]QDE81616.1 hypothetical protein BHS07_08585 [Myxococcus xanthus]QDE95939.1 hypothetical protein BHS05_08715 [Myxococcus xanthus]QDF03278.1 hypothetical protein BHS04_08630 [Myxococcus xanthus]
MARKILSSGQHSNALPHINLQRATLPWERLPGQADENKSWLALLLFRESDFANGEERPRVRTLTLRELLAMPAATARVPSLTPEPGQQESNEAVVIDVQRRLLEPLVPTLAELEFLAHAHVRKSTSGVPEGEAEATLISKRLPDPGGRNDMYLVSLEGRYRNEAFDFMARGRPSGFAS